MSVFGSEAETPRRGGGTVHIRASVFAAMLVGVILAGIGVFMAGLEIGRRQGVQEGIARMMPTSIPAEQVLGPEPGRARRPRPAPVPPAEAVAEAPTASAELTVDDSAGVPGGDMKAADLERRQTRPKGWEQVDGNRPPPPGAGRSWAVQVLATPNEREAMLLVQKLETAGYPVFVTPTRKDGLTWHRVRVGTYGARTEAQTVAKELKRRFELPTWVLE